MKRRRHQGFTMVELMIATAILLLLGGALTGSVASLRDLSTSGNVEQRLQTMATRSMARILSDLQLSSFATTGLANPYPYLFDDGNALGAFAIHAHGPAAHQAIAGDTDFGPTREIVFVLPADFDGDERPDLDVNGDLVWDPTEISFVLVDRGDGVNLLERRVDGANPETLASYVERLAFDSNATDITLPLNAVRVRIYFRHPDDEGRIYRYFVESLVRLRN